MSKKDKKRIAELERQQSILLATMRVLRKDFNTLSLSIVYDKIDAMRAANSFQAGTIPSEKEQEKTEQPQQSEAEKERELMGKVNAELGKFATLEAFNADRIKKFLPPVGKLEFHKMKAAIECTIAIAKMVRPDYFDQIDQIKIPQVEQDKPEQSQPENHRENLGEPVLNKPEQFKKGQFDAEKLDASLSKLASLPLKSEQELAEAKRANRINAALKDAVDDLAKHLNFTLENFGKDRAKQVEMLQAYCDHFKDDLADFRRKVLSVSELVEPKQDETTPPAPEQKEAEKSGSELGGTDGADSPTRANYCYIIIVNHKQGGIPLYMLDFNHQVCDGLPDMSIDTTYTKQRAYKFEHIKQAQNIIDLAKQFQCFDKHNFFIDALQ